jgi:hypothetical protein
VSLAGGRLAIRGLALQLADPVTAVERERSGRRSLIMIAGGKLDCEGVVLGMPVSGKPVGEATPAAFVTVAGADPVDAEITLVGVRAGGDADLLEVAATGGGKLALRWEGGAVVTSRHLIALEGTRSPMVLECVLENVVAACGNGLVVSRDSVAVPLPVRLSMRASGCRFAVTDPGRPFVEWSGIGTPTDYAAGADWQDRHGRYEGGPIFMRIDGAAERVELPFGDPAVPLVHDPVVGTLPKPGDWAGWGL